MTASVLERHRRPNPAPADAARPARRRRRTLAGYAFVAGYLVLLVLFGVIPVGYALYLALTNSAGQVVGVGNFTRTTSDYRFGPALTHMLVYLAIWLVALTVVVIVSAVMLHGRLRRTSAVARFVYYLPGALAGAASALVWMFMLDPSVSPAAALLRATGQQSFSDVIAPDHLPFVFAVIAFWTGAGGWIIVMYGALNTIPTQLMEAARMDGANVVQIAWRIQIPMLRKWIAYMLILAFATGSQIFVEPQLVGSASLGQVSDSWSPNQLAYQFAFANNDFHGSAAVSMVLLLLSLVCAAIVVTRSRLFEID